MSGAVIFHLFDMKHYSSTKDWPKIPYCFISSKSTSCNLLPKVLFRLDDWQVLTSAQCYYQLVLLAKSLNKADHVVEVERDSRKKFR